jgi:Fe-S cluster assembly ATP-binding protein
MLQIQNLYAKIEEKHILKGLDIEIKPGEVHAIMGPNGAGKSTLASLLAGREYVEVEQGTVTFNGEDLLRMVPEERAVKGVFLAFQYPVEIPGVSTANFLKTAVNAVRKSRGEEPLDAVDFLKEVKEKMALLEMKEEFLRRPLNEGFSGGEKKRAEMLQMLMLEPKLVIMDETDSGLDIDSLKIVANATNSYRSADRSFLVVTHYQRLLDYIHPDVVHVFYEGKIIKTGGKELATELEKEGYDRIIETYKAQEQHV